MHTAQQAAEPGAPAAHTHKAPNYMAVFAGLFVLTVAEVLVAFVSHMPKRVLVIVLVALALWKATLVALYYMHLKFEPRKLWFVVMSPFPLAFILVLVILAEKL